MAGVCESSPTGKYAVCFNHPKNAEDDNAIIDRIVELVNATGTGDEIRFAMYEMAGAPARRVIDALRSAVQRGAYVRAVLDDADGGSTDAIEELRSFVNHVEVCFTSCIKNSGNINHDKFFLFETGSSRTVLQTSSNLDPVQVKNFNDSIEVRNDDALYEAMLAYWQRLQGHGWDGWTTNASRDHPGDVSDGLPRTKLSVFPRREGEPGQDPFVDALAGTASCTSYHFTTGSLDEYRVGVLGGLRGLEGCDVKAIVQRQSAGCYELEQLIGEENVRMFRQDGEFPNIHSKSLVMDGSLDGTAGRFVWTGSDNLTYNATFENDETWLKVVDNDFVSTRYAEQWQKVWDQATLSWRGVPAEQRTPCGAPTDEEIRQVENRES